jgi:hypothetical protein
MAMSKSEVIGWLVGRVEWEQTLAELHAHAVTARLPAEDLSLEPRPEAEPRPRGLRPRPRTRKLRSPIRGMSRVSLLSRMRS